MRWAHLNDEYTKGRQTNYITYKYTSLQLEHDPLTE